MSFSLSFLLPSSSSSPSPSPVWPSQPLFCTARLAHSKSPYRTPFFGRRFPRISQNPSNAFDLPRFHVPSPVIVWPHLDLDTCSISICTCFLILPLLFPDRCDDFSTTGNLVLPCRLSPTPRANFVILRPSPHSSTSISPLLRTVDDPLMFRYN